ncbi:MAG: right-handed parallel beta-helix repeat-containing protein [Deltaproteobacteria bacterium]|nr:right-handed parallel beta-helix repeat-containing protein [Deltaproteobacteria bacterium]
MKPVHLVTLLGLAAGLSALWGPAAAQAATITVNPGDSIQAAVDAAAPGDTVKVMPGDYTEPAVSGPAVRITKSLKLLAKSKLKDDIRVRILAGPGQTDGIVVEPANPGDPDVVGVKIQGFTVEGFPNNGIWLKHVQKFTIQGNESVNNLENGIWPTLSAKGSVKKNVSYGSQDSALWVEASEDVRVMQNELYDSPTGFEVTISKGVKATKNYIHDNTVGVGLYHPNGAGMAAPPGLLNGGDWVFKSNRIVNNNKPNTAPPGSMPAALPPGVGVLVLGVDGVTIEKNEITGNDFVGVVALDWCIAVDGTAFDCVTNPPLIQSAPDNNLVRKNKLGSNGASPPGGIFDLLAGDLALTAFPFPPYAPIGGHNNCFTDNEPVPPQTSVTYNSLGSSPNECN